MSTNAKYSLCDTQSIRSLDNWTIIPTFTLQWAEENNKVISEDLQFASAKVAERFALKTDQGIQSSTEELLSKIDEVRVPFDDFEVFRSEKPLSASGGFT